MAATLLHAMLCGFHQGTDNWQSEMASVTKKGYVTILSSPWYLNYISYGNVWDKTYTVDPEGFNGSIASQ